MDPFTRVALPHTSNTLTTQQRALLMRKAKKIEQILGCPPHLVDETTTNRKARLLSRPFATLRFRTFRHSRSSSIDSSSSTSTSSSDSLEDDARSSSYCQPKIKNSSHRSGYSITTRLDLNPTPPSNQTSWSSKPALSVSMSDLSEISDDGIEDETLHPAFAPVLAPTSPASPTRIPTFSIPTANSFRKAKIDRLRKKLGSGFPVELVFPDEDDVSRRPSRTPAKSRPLSCILPFRKKKVAKASHSRVTSPQKCPPPKRSQNSKYSDTLPPVPHSPVPLVSKATSVTDLKVTKQPLSLILESPDEYVVDVQEVLKDSSPSIITSPTSSCSGHSWNSHHGASNFKKRPPSYRKPPPKIPDDLIS